MQPRSIGVLARRAGWLTYLASWVTQDLTRCYQVMECSDRALLDAWMAGWSDLVDFEVIPVVTSADAASRFK